METTIVFIAGLLFKIYVFGQIYLFWIQRVLPTLQKHYFIAKSDVAALEEGQLTSKSNIPNLQKDVFTLKSTSAVVHKDVSTLHSASAVVRKYFSMLNSVSAVLQNYFSRRNVFQQSCKKTFQHQKVFLQQFGYMIRTWNSIYAHLHICYAASKSLSIALLKYIKTSIRNSPFLHRNFPLIMRYIYNRKQHVSS